MAVGQDKAVAPRPVRVARRVPEVLAENAPADRREAHRAARVAAVGSLDGVDGEPADDVRADVWAGGDTDLRKVCGRSRSLIAVLRGRRRPGGRVGPERSATIRPCGACPLRS